MCVLIVYVFYYMDYLHSLLYITTTIVEYAVHYTDAMYCTAYLSPPHNLLHHAQASSRYLWHARGASFAHYFNLLRSTLLYISTASYSLVVARSINIERYRRAKNARFSSLFARDPRDSVEVRSISS